MTHYFEVYYNRDYRSWCLLHRDENGDDLEESQWFHYKRDAMNGAINSAHALMDQGESAMLTFENQTGTTSSQVSPKMFWSAWKNSQ